MQHAKDYETMTLDELLEKLDQRLEEAGPDGAIPFEEGDAVVFGHLPPATVRLWMAAAGDRYDHTVEHCWIRVEKSADPDYEEFFYRCEAQDAGAQKATWGDCLPRRVDELTAEELRDWLEQLDEEQRRGGPPGGGGDGDGGLFAGHAVSENEAEALLRSGEAE